MVQRPPRRGEVWRVLTPGQPDDPHQPRRALVVSSNARNFNADDAIVVPIFSQGSLGPTRVMLPQGIGGMRWDSVLFCEEITTISHQFFVEGPLGTHVPVELMDRVVRAVRRALGEVVPEPALKLSQNVALGLVPSRGSGDKPPNYRVLR